MINSFITFFLFFIAVVLVCIVLHVTYPLKLIDDDLLKFYYECRSRKDSLNRKSKKMFLNFTLTFKLESRFARRDNLISYDQVKKKPITYKQSYRGPSVRP